MFILYVRVFCLHVCDAYVGILDACMQCLRRPGEGAGFSGTGGIKSS